MSAQQDRGSYQPLTYFQLMEVSLRELLVEKGVLSEQAVSEAVEDMRHRGPDTGARVVARAWVDAAFKGLLLENGTRACQAMDIDVPALKLVVVENTPQVHNVIVCTLCSCYPRMLLGIPPDWYKSRNYRSRVVREPRAVLAEFGLRIADDVTIRVHDSTADMRYMVLPMRPAGTEGWDEARLASIVSRDCMIGVAIPTPPTPPTSPTRPTRPTTSTIPKT
jgi:nitrile hydratase